MNITKRSAVMCLGVAIVLAVGSGCDYEYDNPVDKDRDGGNTDEDSSSKKDANDGPVIHGEDGSDGKNSSDIDDDGFVCDASVFEDRVVAFCRTQYPSPPEHGELGASCVDHEQCDSVFCLRDYNGSSDRYCSIDCPNGNECPIGYDCKDSSSGWPVCHKADCDFVFVDDDVSRCITAILGEAKDACTYVDCGTQFSKWIDCLVAGERFCGDADEACGVERGLLESCMY